MSGCVYGSKRASAKCGCSYCRLQTLKNSKLVKDAAHRENVREVGRENVAEFRERVEGRSLEDWHRDVDT